MPRLSTGGSTLENQSKTLIKEGVESLEALWVALVVRNPPANAGDIRNLGSIPVIGRSPEGGHDKPLHYSCLENPTDRGARQATVA